MSPGLYICTAVIDLSALSLSGSYNTAEDREKNNNMRRGRKPCQTPTAGSINYSINCPGRKKSHGNAKLTVVEENISPLEGNSPKTQNVVLTCSQDDLVKKPNKGKVVVSASSVDGRPCRNATEGSLNLLSSCAKEKGKTVRQ